MNLTNGIGEFKNKDVIEFFGSKGIKREYSNARTSQQNGVVERKNRNLIEAARTMLADSFLPNTFWAEAVRISLPSTIIPDSIPASSGGNLGGHSSSDKSLSGNEGEMTLQSVYDLCLSLCAHVSDQA
ncbi:putative ribonuclease H-like domain-containing protein [Tanacetum coccineum]